MPDRLTRRRLPLALALFVTSCGDGGGPAATHSVTLSSGVAESTFGDWQTRFGRTFASTLLAVRQDGDLLVSRPWDQPVRECAMLYHVAGERVDHRVLSHTST